MNAVSDKSWWQRNRVALLVVAAIITLMCAFVMIFFSLFTSSDAYVMALAAARADSRVTDRLGTPLETGWFTTGNIRTSGDGSGSANLAIPLSGPKSSGTLYATARRTDGEWKLLRLTLQDADGKHIALMAPLGAAVTDSSDD